MDNATMDAQQIQKVAVDWLTRRASEEWSAVDQAQFDAWMHETLAHRIAYLRVESVWNQVGRLQAVGASGTRGTVPPRGLSLKWVPPVSDPVSSAVSRSRPLFGFPHWATALAASVGLLTVVAAGLYVYGLFPLDRYTTRIGDIDTVVLDDGSDVILNTDSRIRVDIQSNMRRVELARGEAFFKVAKDPIRPFVVEVGDKRVTAVGTQFSVRRVQDDVHVVVTEGAVRLENLRGEPAPSELLYAGSVARTHANAVAVERRTAVQMEEFLSWRQGYLVFRDSLLDEAVAEFNRYNTRRIVIDDPAIASIRIGGHFHATSTDVFLWMLKNGFPVTVEDRGREVVLKSR